MNDTLLTIYEQANEHLRASDTKRDQMIAFYLVIIGVVFSAIDKLNDLTPVVAASVGVLGIVIALNVVIFRKWHIVYVNSAILIQYMSIHNLEPTETQIASTWEKLIVDQAYTTKINSRGKKLQPIRAELLTYIAFLLIAFTPFYLISSSWWMCIVHLAYILIMVLVSNWILKRELADGYQSSWLLKLNAQEKPQ